MNYHIITEPLIGAVIGYITNDIAIKMLFRPANPVYFKGHQLPFTPGLIPKEKGRLAEAVGKAVGETLLAPDTVKEALLSERITGKIDAAAEEFIESLRQNENSVECAITQKTGEEAFVAFRDTWENKIADMLAEKLNEADVGAMASKGATDIAKSKVPSFLTSIARELLDDRLKGGIQAQIRGSVNDYVKDHARDILYNALHSEMEKLLQTQVSAIVTQNEEKLPLLKEKLLAAYRQGVTNGLEKVLQGIDLATIVREKIESFDNLEMERLILKLARTELRAIVWLGAALGCVMGLFNLLIP